MSVDPTANHERQMRPSRHRFMSPHYDDIALSCGGLAATLVAAGRTPEVAILFGAEPDPAMPLTGFARAMHAGWGMGPHDAIVGRRSEEAAASALLGTAVEILPFHDAIYRGERYLNDPELFGVVREDEAATLPDQLAAAIVPPGVSQGETRLYAPLAIGFHVDHQVAFAAGVELARSGWDVWFYEDLPYALRPGNRDARFAAVAAGLEVAALVDVADVWDRKIDAIMAYPSQLTTIFSYVDAGSSRNEIDGLMRAYAEEAGHGRPAERYWRLSA